MWTLTWSDGHLVVSKPWWAGCGLFAVDSVWLGENWCGDHLLRGSGSFWWNRVSFFTFIWQGQSFNSGFYHLRVSFDFHIGSGARRLQLSGIVARDGIWGPAKFLLGETSLRTTGFRYLQFWVEMQGATASDDNPGVGPQPPWNSIPKFVPGTTNVQEYVQKLRFLASLWPKEHLEQLAPRAALLVEGSAFKKVARLDPEKLRVKSTSGIALLVWRDWWILGLYGTWRTLRILREISVWHNSTFWWEPWQLLSPIWSQFHWIDQQRNEAWRSSGIHSSPSIYFATGGQEEDPVRAQWILRIQAGSEIFQTSG